MRDSEAVVTPFMQVATYATRNFAHTIPIFRSGMDFLFIQFAHMPYNHYVCLCIAPITPNAQSTLDTQRKVSEDPKDFGFLRIIQSLAYYCIQVSRFPHISQRFWFPADCPISCIFTVYKYQKLIQCTLSLCIAYIPKILVSCGLTNLLYITVYKYQGSRIYPKNFGFLRIIQSLAFYCIQVSRFPHICLHCAIMFTVYKYQEL